MKLHSLSSGNTEVWIVETREFIVEVIDGDYALLRRTDAVAEGLLRVARALLPEETDEGTRLRYEWLQYSVIG